jgi:hypothetical protein
MLFAGWMKTFSWTFGVINWLDNNFVLYSFCSHLDDNKDVIIWLDASSLRFPIIIRIDDKFAVIWLDDNTDIFIRLDDNIRLNICCNYLTR